MNMVTRDEVVDLIRDGKRYRERRGKWERIWAALLVQLILAPLNGWLFMLAIGMVHNHWWPAVPTIGYWWAVAIAYVLPVSLRTITWSKS